MQFNPQEVVNYAKLLVCHDEVEKALAVLEMLPGALRENPPKEIEALRRKIHALIFTAHDYMVSHLDSNVSEASALSALNNTLRGTLVRDEVKRLNELGKVPHLVDFGPGEYFIPIGLYKMGFNFTYKPIGLNHKALDLACSVVPSITQRERRVDDNPIIFLAMEIIEHLSNIEEISYVMRRHCEVEPISIHLSTPCGTYDVKETFEQIKELPHLRTYTPNEFAMATHQLFPAYKVELYNSMVMSIRAVHPSYPQV